MPEFKQWPGLFSDADPHDITPGGAVLQDNWQCVRPGALTVRKGPTRYNFSTATGAPTDNTGDVLGIYAYNPPAKSYVVFHTASGGVYYGNRASGNPVETGVAVNHPNCWCETRDGKLIRVNGVQRGTIYNGVAAYSLGVDAPAAAPTTVRQEGGGNLGAGVYTMAYRYVDSEGIPSALSAVSTITASANDHVHWTVTAPTQARVAMTGGTVELYRSTADQATTLYRVASIAYNGTLTAVEDAASDATLMAAFALPIVKSTGALSARRFVVPPDNLSVVVRFQDRYWYGVPKQVTIENYIANVSGWNTAIVGHYLYREGAVPVEITAAAVGPPTTVTINGSPVQTSTIPGAMVGVAPNARNAWYYSEVDEPESVPTSQNEVIVQTNVEDNDEPTGMCPRGAYAWVFRERHTYRLAFEKQPNIDSAITLAFSRGCVNQRCWAVFEDTVFAMDEYGAWAIVGGQKKNISDPIQNYWSTPLIDWAHKDWFFASVEPTEGILRFHVVLTTDGSITRPMRALCMNVRSGEWWTESWSQAMGGACLTSIGNRMRLVVGGENGDVLTMDDAVYDVVTPVSGTITTASTSTTLTDETVAGFLSTHVGAPIVITGGTGKGAVRYITARVSASQITIDSELTVDTTSTYTVGAIRAMYTSGLQELPDKDEDKEKGQRGILVVWQPTTNANTLQLSRTNDHDTAAVQQIVQNAVGQATSGPGTAYTMLNMKRAQSSVAGSPGFQRWPFTQKADKNLLASRWLSLSLEAYQSNEQLTVYEAGLD